MGHYYSFEKGPKIYHSNAEHYDETAPTVVTENKSSIMYNAFYTLKEISVGLYRRYAEDYDETASTVVTENNPGAEIDNRNAEDDDTAPTVVTKHYPAFLGADYDEEDTIVNRWLHLRLLCPTLTLKGADLVSSINKDERSGWEDDDYESFFIDWCEEEAYGEEAYGERKFGDSYKTDATIWTILAGQKAKHEQENEVQCTEEDEIMQQKKEKLMCKICYINQLNVLFLPCSHMVACSGCASKLMRCAVCRADIKEALPVYYD